MTGLVLAALSALSCLLPSLAEGQSVLWTARKNGGFYDSEALPGSGDFVLGKRALAVDGSGNVYVTGVAFDANWDYLTVSYDSAGNTRWAKVKNGAANSAEQAYALAVGGSGNVYVTGYSNNGTNDDYLTVAYDSAGNELWAKVKSGAANGEDKAAALAVDGSGNVYVTGQSFNGTNYDYLTVAYDGAGNELWAKVRNGPANGADQAYDLAVDASGKVYVTGQSFNGTNYDYLTVAYDSAGNELWATAKNGAANRDDFPHALAVDGVGNVYVAGQSFRSGGSDYLTVAYDDAGNELWAKIASPLGSAYALAVDGSGNIYVTGFSSNAMNYDYLTVAYDGGGNELWAKVKNGAANRDDFPHALAVDAGGNVYVTGRSSNAANDDYLTVAYDSVGNEQWSKVRNGAANNTDQAYSLAVAGSGTVYATGESYNGTNNDYLTVAYDSTGSELWARKEPPTKGSDDRPGSGDSLGGKRALVVAASGNVYVTGKSSNGAASDYLTVAYNSGGQELWARVKNSPSNGWDAAGAVAVDGSENVYVTGWSSNGANDDYLTVAYDSAGNELWARARNGTANGYDVASAVAVGGNGNIYVTGWSSNGTNSDYLTVAYDSAGKELWAKAKNGAANGYDSASALAVDGGGNVYVSGYSFNGTNSDYLTVAYNSTGNELWAKAKDGAANSDDYPYALAVDGNGNVWVTGSSYSATNGDYLTVAYDSTGNELWAKVRNGAPDGYAEAFGLAKGGSGIVFVTGHSSSGTNDDYLTVAYDNAGNELWAKAKNGAGNGADAAFALAVGGDGNVYVTGSSSNGTNDDYLTVAYDATGNELWQHVEDRGGADVSYAIATTAAGRIVVAGSSDGQSADFFTVELSDDSTPPSADLAITKTDGVTIATPGSSVLYTVVASNPTGPSAAPGTTVADAFPAACTSVSYTSVNAGGASGNTASGAGNINDTAVVLPVGGSVTYTATCNIGPAATGALTNTATVTAAGGVSDPTPGNNSATDTDTLTSSADLAITKTDGVTTATPGGSVVYTIVASNPSGPSSASGTTVADTFPAACTSVSYNSVIAGGVSGNTASGAGNINDTAVTLPVGGSVTYTATCNISAAATGTLTNTATVTAAGGVSDPTPGNNSATDADTLTPSADLAITKTDGVVNTNPSATVIYTIVASNAGPSDAPGSAVADAFPAGCASHSFSSVTAGGATGNTAGPSSGNISDTLSLPSGSSVTYTASCTLSGAATSPLVNTATLAVGSGVTDPSPGNNSATDTDTVGNAVFADGFESGDRSHWSGSAGLTFEASSTRPLAAGATSASFDFDLSALPATRAFGPTAIATLTDSLGRQLFLVNIRRGAADAPLELELVAADRISGWAAVAESRQRLRLEWTVTTGQVKTLSLSLGGHLGLWLEGFLPTSQPAILRVMRDPRMLQ